MSSRLFDPAGSRAVLIGVSRYTALPPLKPVSRSLKAMHDVLTDPRVCRLPRANCTVIPDPLDGNAVGRALGRAAGEASDMLLVYYAGHGLGGLRRSQLYLAFGDTDPTRPAFHSLNYDVLREEVLDSSARNRIVILDCCFSGRAAAPVLAGESDAILQQLDIEGAYVLTASPGNAPALVGSTTTEFTGELVQALRGGVPGAPPLLTLDTLYTHLRTRTRSRNLPEPRRLHTNAAGQLALARNPLHNAVVDRQRTLQRGAEEIDSVDDPRTLMMVAMNRRSQLLSSRIIGHLDRLERGEEDPDRLAELFQLDHLATRMRRNEENILTLLGVPSFREIRDDAALMDVLRAAQSEIEHYTRIEYRSVDSTITIAAGVTNDLVHLIAEIFDNATAFSPPSSIVEVDACKLLRGALIEVCDSGIGISHERLIDINEDLRRPSEPDFRMMGMQVVARLAARHQIEVELVPSNTRGVVARIVLPGTALAG